MLIPGSKEEPMLRDSTGRYYACFRESWFGPPFNHRSYCERAEREEGLFPKDHNMSERGLSRAGTHLQGVEFDNYADGSLEHG